MTTTLELPKSSDVLRAEGGLDPSVGGDGSYLVGFQALSDPIRLQVLELLRTQELCVGELCDALGGIAQSKLSFHLKVLKQADTTDVKKQPRLP